MHVERLRAANVRRLAASENDFADGPVALRRWTVLGASKSSDALLRSLAPASLGRRQMEAFAPRLVADLAERHDGPIELEAVLIRHAPQECGLRTPARRRIGWRFHPDGRVETFVGSGPSATESTANRTVFSKT